MELNSEVLGKIENYLKRILKDQGSVNQDMMMLCHSFLDSVSDHNDKIARFVPICGSNSLYSFLSVKPVNGQQESVLRSRQNSVGKLDGEVFEIEVDANKECLGSSTRLDEGIDYSSPKNSVWTMVSRASPTPGSSPSFGATASRPASAALSSPNNGPLKIQTPNGARARIPSIESSPGKQDNGSSSPWKIVATNTSATASSSSSTTPYKVSPRMINNVTPKISTVLPSNSNTFSKSTYIPLGTKQPIAKSPPVSRSKLNPSNGSTALSMGVGLSSPPSMGSVINPIVTDVPNIRLSQKERKRLNREREQNRQQQQNQKQPESSSSAIGWGTPFLPTSPPTSNTPWNIRSTSSEANKQPSVPSPTVSPFATFSSNKNKEKLKKPPETPAFTLGDIILQEKRDLKRRNEKSSRSLKDIQQEEEFEKWWALESQRAQGIVPSSEEEQSSEPIAVNKVNDNIHNRGKNNKSNHQSRSSRRDSNSGSSPTAASNSASNSHPNHRRHRRLAVNT